MKNLKKVLALVLAFACAFTMFAGAASFTDQADIAQTEAVDMLTALGVIEGYQDGSFRPDETVTRAEMAKMIYVIRNGGSDVVTQYEGYKTPFTDVENVNHWAKGYIAYCYANGIIAGKSATKFDPDATVTGTEAAKMALVLIGYDAEKAGLEGSAWSTNTVNLATQKDLFANYSISITGGCDRQFAAQLLYNTLWAGTVRWSNDSNGYEDVVDYNQDNNGVVVGLAYVTVAKRYMGLEEVIATYLGDSKANPAALSDGQSAIAYFDRGAQQFATITYVPESGNDLLGESVKVLYKNSKDGTSDQPDKYDTVYGVTLSGETTTVKATLSDIGDVTNGKIKVDGNTYSIAAATRININTNAVTGEVSNADDFTSDYQINSDVITIPAGQGLKQDSADTLKLVLDNGTVIGAYINHVNFYKVTGLTASKITLGGYGALDIDDTMTLADDVAVNDIVAVTTLYANELDDDDAYNIIEKAEVVEDVTVTGVRSDGQEVRIDGNWMKYAAINDEVTGVDGNYENKVELNSTYDFIVYGNTWVAAKKVAASSKDIALVTDIDTGINDPVKVLKSDGSEAVYNINDSDDDAWDYADITNNNNGNIATRLFSFSLVGDNGIELKNDNITDNKHANTVVGLDFYKANTANYVQDNKTVVVGGSTKVTAADAVAYIEVAGSQDDDGFYAYQIDNLKSFQGARNVEYALNDDDEVVAFFGTLNMKPGSTASNDQYGYVVDDPAYTSNNGTKSWTMSVWNGTETIDITVEGTTIKAGVAKGAFIKFALTGEGTAEAGDISVLTDGNKGIVGSYSANRKLLTLINSNGTTAGVYSVADDVVIIGVNTKDKELVEGIGDPIASIKATDGSYPVNIMYVVNNNGTADKADDEVVAIFVDSNNEIIDGDNNDGTLIPGGPAFVET